MRHTPLARFHKPGTPVHARHVALHANELGGNVGVGTFEKLTASGRFDACCTVVGAEIDGSQVQFASSGQIAQLGLFGKFEVVLNDFLGGQFITVDELQVAAGALAKVGPDINSVQFQSSDSRELHETLSSFGPRNSDGFGNSSNGEIEQVFIDAGRGIQGEVFALFFSGDKPDHIFIQTNFTNHDGGALRNAYQNNVEPVLREIAAAAGLATDQIFTQDEPPTP